MLSNSTRVMFRHPMLAMAATAAIVFALMAGMSLVTNGTAASGVNVGAYATSASASPTAMPTSEPSELAFPKAQGWKGQPNRVKFRITKRGYVYFWTAKKGNAVALGWDRGSALPGIGTGFYYGEEPKRFKIRKCGVRTRVEIWGYELAQLRRLPAWPCKLASK